jgi:uncharacterized protein
VIFSHTVCGHKSLPGQPELIFFACFAALRENMKNLQRRKPLKSVKHNSDHKTDPELCAQKLKAYFSKKGHAIVAYSGGVDSALLAYVAHLALGNEMVAALSDSPSLSRREYRFAVNFTQENGIPLQIIRTQEMEDPHYLANPANRCYYCKKALFEKINELRQELRSSVQRSAWPIFYGVNLDDLGDFRPGIQAAEEASILAPYVDLGFDKNTIRAMCNYFGLEIAHKPAMPCLSSRIRYGEAVTVEKLNQVELAEDFLYDLGFRILRVRHHGDTARIEIPPENFGTLIKQKDKIREKFHELGFAYVSMDLDGFKSGSLNAVLKLT